MAKMEYSKRTGRPGNYIYWHKAEDGLMHPGDKPTNVDEINSKPRYEFHPHDEQAGNQIGHTKQMEKNVDEIKEHSTDQFVKPESEEETKRDPQDPQEETEAKAENDGDLGSRLSALEGFIRDHRIHHLINDEDEEPEDESEENEEPGEKEEPEEEEKSDEDDEEDKEDEEKAETPEENGTKEKRELARQGTEQRAVEEAKSEGNNDRKTEKERPEREEEKMISVGKSRLVRLVKAVEICLAKAYNYKAFSPDNEDVNKEPLIKPEDEKKAEDDEPEMNEEQIMEHDTHFGKCPMCRSMAKKAGYDTDLASENVREHRCKIKKSTLGRLLYVLAKSARN